MVGSAQPSPRLEDHCELQWRCWQHVACIAAQASLGDAGRMQVTVERERSLSLASDAGLDDESQRCGLHVRQGGRLRRELEEVRVELRRGAHAQVTEVGHALLRMHVDFVSGCTGETAHWPPTFKCRGWAQEFFCLPPQGVGGMLLQIAGCEVATDQFPMNMRGTARTLYICRGLTTAAHLGDLLRLAVQRQALVDVGCQNRDRGRTIRS